MTYRRVFLDFYGHSPTYDDLEAFSVRSEGDPWATIDEALSRCLDSEFWLGKNGVQVRPIGAIKDGYEDVGATREPGSADPPPAA